MSFKIKRKLHPKYPDYIPALKIAGPEGDLVQSIQYSHLHGLPVATVRFKTPIMGDGMKASVRAYKYNGNTWVLMGKEHV